MTRYYFIGDYRSEKWEAGHPKKLFQPLSPASVGHNLDKFNGGLRVGCGSLLLHMRLSPLVGFGEDFADLGITVAAPFIMTFRKYSLVVCLGTANATYLK